MHGIVCRHNFSRVFVLFKKICASVSSGVSLFMFMAHLMNLNSDDIERGLTLLFSKCAGLLVWGAGVVLV